jgi:hypothetical protein
MEILDLKFGGITLGVWLGAIGLWYITRNAWREWREQRSLNKEIDEARKKFKAEHVWQTRMVGGVDCGEWVRKEGRPIED